jgi:peptidoglycan hydrolase-like protein with peptidoglycan-binding domain
MIPSRRLSSALAATIVCGAVLAGGTTAATAAPQPERTAITTATATATATPVCHGYTRFTGVSYGGYRNYQTWRPTSYNGIGYTNCVMRPGYRVSGVRLLQTVYNACYSRQFGFRLAVDGIYGSRTTYAVRLIQRHHHVRDDGVYGPQTRWNMRWLHWHEVRHAGWPEPQWHSHCL